MKDEQAKAAKDEGGRDALAYERISDEAIGWLFAPLRAYFSPRFFGMDNVAAAHPTMFVGNHTIYGLFDGPVLAAELALGKRIRVRTLVDEASLSIPGVSDLLRRAGAVADTDENCAELMKRKQHLMVFPGGDREAARRKGDSYKLLWKRHTYFVRLAVKHGYSITPFACVGADNAYDILVDADDIMGSPLGRILDAVGLSEKYLKGGEAIPPLARGLGLSLLPRPERLYFSIKEPIDTAPLAGKADDEDALFALRDEVRDAVNALIRDLLDIREKDRDQSLLRRLINRIG